jgi:hypothetical protein
MFRLKDAWKKGLIHMQFCIDVADMRPDGADADAIFFGNFFITEPFHQ